MKPFMLWAVLIVTLGAGILVLDWSQSSSSDGIVKMAQKGASEAELQKAVAGQAGYELNADDVIKLNAAGVSNAVIIEMLHKSKSTRVATTLNNQTN